MAMEISHVVSSYANIYSKEADSKKKAAEGKEMLKTDKTSAASAEKISTSDYLAQLQKKNPKLNIRCGSADTSMGAGSYPNKIDVSIAPNILAQMATDPETAEKWEKALAGIPTAASWAASAINAMTGSHMLYIHYWIDADGNMGACSASGPSPEEVGNMIEERKRQQEEQLEERMEAVREKREKLEKWMEEHRESLKVKEDDPVEKKLARMGVGQYASDVKNLYAQDKDLQETMRIMVSYKPFHSRV